VKKSRGEFDEGNDIVRESRQKGGHERKHGAFLAFNRSFRLMFCLPAIAAPVFL
jgi:hypothetical protein